MPKILIALNTAWNLVNFRSSLIAALVQSGYEVVAVAPNDQYAERLSTLGCRYVPLPMDNKGTHPGRDALLLWRFLSLLRHERPDVLLSYTIKPNVYGSLAAHMLGIPVVNNIAGLGAVFIKGGWLMRLVSALYALALSRSAKVFFQNDDDRRMFVEEGLVRREATDLLPGSGIDLERYLPVPVSEAGKQRFRFLLIARMLWDKGVGEYIAAARMIKQRHVNVEFCLLGFLDVENPAAITRAQMDDWVAENIVSYLGVTDDVRPFIADADCVVLPSYREGTPRTLLEAAAMGRPIVTTDTVGCREVVKDGVNGYLCRVQDADGLAEKMERLIAMSPEQRQAMGRRGREMMENQFDEKIVIEKYLHAIRDIIDRKV